MSLIPAFELGLWNAWIFILPLILISIPGARILGRRNSGEYTLLTKKEKKFAILYMVVLFASYGYSVFLPLQLGTVWFYLGFSIFLLGMLIEVLTMFDFAMTPVDKPVTRGVYRFSRNPMYVGEILVYLSIVLACVSWIFFIVTLGTIIIRQVSVAAEERFCLKKYGDDYRVYMRRTPRWIGMPKS